MSDIVNAAGTSVGLAYYHFGNKLGIFLALWSQYQEAQQRRTSDAIRAASQAGLSGQELLMAGTRAYLEGAWDHRDLVPVVHGRGLPAGFSVAMAEGAERWHRQMLALLPDFEKRTARHIVIMLSEAFSSTCVEVARCRSRQAADTIIDDVLHLVGGALDGMHLH